MRIALLTAVVLGTLCADAPAQPLTQPPARAPACDRGCLEGYIDRYLQAMLNQEVSNALFARNVRFTENGIELPLGDEGLWYGMSGLGGYRFYVPDLETQQVAFIGTVKENMATHGANDDSGNNVAVAIRLKIVEGRITEVEQLAIRPPVQLGNRPPPEPGPFGVTGDNVLKMGEPHAIFKAPVPERERHTREELVEIANYYFTGLARNDSKGYYPFTEDCIRYENGIKATRTNCLDQFVDGSLNGVVSRIRDRRFVAVDVERGIAFAFAFFDHHRINWTWQLAELFRIENGRIRRIEAVFHQAPFGTQSGWSTWEQSISEAIQSVR